MVQKNPIVSISLVAVVAIAASKLDLFSPLANGKIPAAKKQPHENKRSNICTKYDGRFIKS